METVILSIILMLVLIIIFSKIRQLVRVIRGKEVNACDCDNCACSCSNRKDCGTRDDFNNEPPAVYIKLDPVLKSERPPDLIDSQVIDSKNGGE